MCRLRYTILAGVFLLAACNDSRKPNDRNFKNAINQYLKSHGYACTWFVQKFPINVSAIQEKLSSGLAPQMQVLEKAGLVHSTETTTDISGVFGGSTQQHVKRYELTATGTKYLEQKQGILSPITGLCYGDKTVDSIVKWTEPTSFGPVTQTEVTYTYKISNLAPWAQRTDIQNEFSDVRATVSGSSKMNETITLQLTNKGWEVPAQ